MNKRISILALFLVAALFICEVNLTVTGTSYPFDRGALKDNIQVQSQSVSSAAGRITSQLGTPELIGSNNGSVFYIRTQTEGKGPQRSGARFLLLFTLILCLLGLTLRDLRFGILGPGDTNTSSTILSFIHNKDGKK